MADVLDITDAGELRDVIDAKPVVVIKFTAPAWCRPCQQFAPHYKATAAKRDDVTFVSVDIDNAPWAMVDYGVRGVPTVMLYRDGKYVKNIVGRTVIQILSELDS